MKNLLTSSGIESATFRFVAQHLNHCATAVPSKWYKTRIPGDESEKCFNGGSRSLSQEALPGSYIVTGALHESDLGAFRDATTAALVSCGFTFPCVILDNYKHGLAGTVGSTKMSALFRVVFPSVGARVPLL